jgi:RNA-directed DNA polymerase
MSRALKPKPNRNYHNIDWRACEKAVYKLQCEIAKAHRDGDKIRVSSLQDQLVRSFAARAIAVRRVTANAGGKTQGIDNVLWDTPTVKFKAIESLSSLKGYTAKPVKRVYVSKPDGSKRPLGIPTLYDRAVQTLWYLALLPIAEASSDTRSYGFRPLRSTHDAVVYVALILKAPRSSKEWILSVDITKFFDSVSHEWLMKNIPIRKSILWQILKAGFVEGKTTFPTNKGFPQGAVISPILGNMTLDGLQGILEPTYRIARYADDFVVLGNTRKALEEEALPRISEFLKTRGLEINLQKTKIIHRLEGFNFLGFKIVEYPRADKATGFKGGLVHFKPQPEKIVQFCGRIKETIKTLGPRNHLLLIKKLNLMLRGWANYYRISNTNLPFARVSAYTWTALWRHLRRRHSNWPLRSLATRYFKTIGKRRWIFFTRDDKGNDIALFQIGQTRLDNHVQIKGESRLFDPQHEGYLAKRSQKAGILREMYLLTKLKYDALKRQLGICPVCDMPLNSETEQMELHHKLPKASGGTDSMDNLVLLHEECHTQITHSTSPELIAAWKAADLIRESKSD